MKKITLLILVFVLSLGCNDSNKDVLHAYEVGADINGLLNGTDESLSKSEESQPELQQNIFDQKIIKTGYFTFETSSIAKTYDEIRSWVNFHQGFIQHDNTRKDYDRINRNLTIRIPSDKFQPIVDSISKSVRFLDRKEIILDDVTEDFVDIEARLKAKQKLEERYLQLLTKATSVKDMLEIERQIANIREEIEAKQGRLKYLQNQVSMSTLQIDFYEMIKGQKAPSQTYLSRLWRGVKGGVNAVGNFIIALTYIWPFILVGILLFIYLRKRYKKRKSKS